MDTASRGHLQDHSFLRRRRLLWQLSSCNRCLSRSSPTTPETPTTSYSSRLHNDDHQRSCRSNNSSCHSWTTNNLNAQKTIDIENTVKTQFPLFLLFCNTDNSERLSMTELFSAQPRFVRVVPFPVVNLTVSDLPKI